MTDAGAIVWKEWREVFGRRGMRGKLGIFASLAVFGIVLPLETGRTWITSPLTVAAWSWMPMFLVMLVISDAIAGERERHTLETLLASRLSDRAILFGKMGAAVAYAGVITAGSLVLGVITVNVATRGGPLMFYSPGMVGGMSLFGLTGAVAVAAAGVLVSLRSPTVRQAEQTLGGAIILVMVAVVGALRIAPPPLKAWVAAPEHAASLGIAAVIGMIGVDAALLFVVDRRFRRTRLLAGGEPG